MQLNNNLSVILDDADFECQHSLFMSDGDFIICRICDFEWCAIVEDNSPVYAVACVKKGVIARMHRLILDCSPSTLVDHRDGNGLNNVRSNLRLATSRQNAMNRSKWKNSDSRFKGVHRDGKRWRAIITLNGKRIHLGCFSSDEEAASAYNKAAMANYGEFAKLNVIEKNAVRFGSDS